MNKCITDHYFLFYTLKIGNYICLFDLCFILIRNIIIYLVNRFLAIFYFRKYHLPNQGFLFIGILLFKHSVFGRSGKSLTILICKYFLILNFYFCILHCAFFTCSLWENLCFCFIEKELKKEICWRKTRWKENKEWRGRISEKLEGWQRRKRKIRQRGSVWDILTKTEKFEFLWIIPLLEDEMM